MKKNTVLIISIAILVLLIGIAQIIPKGTILDRLKVNNTSTLKKELSDFAVKDIENIDKIFIADKANHSVVLEKKGKIWRVNNKFNAREDAIKNLMDVIQNVRVRQPISKAEYETQIKRLATTGRKVEIYKNGTLFKTYYVGGATQDQMGTYMILDNSRVPFIMELSGFTGFLTPRYFPMESLWRENFIFKSNPKNIRLVSVENKEEKEKSFSLKKIASLYHLFDYQGNEIQNIDSLQVKRYLSYFKKISYEALAVNMKEAKKDSLLKSEAFQIIHIETTDNTEQTINIYRVFNDSGVTNDNGEVLKYDPDRVYGFFNNLKDVATVQYRTLDKIAVEPSFFIKQ